MVLKVDKSCYAAMGDDAHSLGKWVTCWAWSPIHFWRDKLLRNLSPGHAWMGRMGQTANVLPTGCLEVQERMTFLLWTLATIRGFISRALNLLVQRWDHVVLMYSESARTGQCKSDFKGFITLIVKNDQNKLARDFFGLTSNNGYKPTHVVFRINRKYWNQME